MAESDTVTIYDGDDPDMPMWMVWEQAGVLSWASETTTTSISITALNGKFVWGTDDRGSGIADFIKDDIEIFHGPTEYVLKDKKISSRSTSSFTTGEGYSIVHPDVKDVAMTVLPNAPIDADTGLPVPTIAVATDGGVSVIKDDGTVISQGVGASIGYIPSNIDFVGTGQIIVGRDTYGNGNRHSHLIDIDNLSSTTNANAAADFVDISSYTGASNQVLPVGNMSGTGVLGLSSEEMAYVHGNPGPLYKFINNGSTASKGSVAKITSDYNTGWMHGDIKLATLSDTDATNVTGSELVTNGTFDSDVVGWTAITSTIAYSSGTMQITRSGGSGYTAYQAISTQVGATYILTATINSSGSTGSVYINNAVSSDPAANVQGTNGQTVDVSLQFVAESTTSYVQFAVDSDGTSISVDNVSVRLAEPDRSVNGNGLQVFGTVTKTAVATGAELVGYSGFSSSNYLQQPYNADLNFGTGSYSIMGWFKTDATNSTGIIAQLGPSDAD